MPLSTLLPWTGQALTRHHRRAAAIHGLSPTSMGVLAALARAGAASHRELAARARVTPATLTPVVDGLEGSGDLRRDRDVGDRRVVRLSITAQGRERWVAAADAVAATLRERLPYPPPDEQAVIRAYLLAVLTSVEAEDG